MYACPLSSTVATVSLFSVAGSTPREFHAAVHDRVVARTVGDRFLVEAIDRDRAVLHSVQSYPRKWLLSIPFQELGRLLRAAPRSVVHVPAHPLDDIAEEADHQEQPEPFTEKALSVSNHVGRRSRSPIVVTVPLVHQGSLAREGRAVKLAPRCSSEGREDFDRAGFEAVAGTVRVQEAAETLRFRLTAVAG